MAARRFLADTYTPSFLMGLCEGLTGFQSDDVVRHFIGEWIRVRGALFQSTPNWAFKTAGVTIELPEERGRRPEVFLTFTRDLDAVGRVQLGETIHAEGRIKSITASQLLLEDCGLIDANIASIFELAFRADELRRAAEAWKPGEAASEFTGIDPEPEIKREQREQPESDSAKDTRPNLREPEATKFCRMLVEGWPDTTEREAHKRAVGFFHDKKVPKHWFVGIFGSIRGPKTRGKQPKIPK